MPGPRPATGLTPMRWLPVAALLFAALPAAATAATELTALEVSAKGGATALGELAAVDIDGGTQLASGITLLTLEATAIDVRIEHMDVNASVAGVGLEPEYWEESGTLEAAALAMQGEGETPAVFVVPLPGAAAPSVSTAATGLQGRAGEPSVTQVRYVDYPGHERIVAGTADATAWTGRGVELSVQGDFLLTFWDFTLSGGTTTIASGARSSDRVWPVQEWHQQQAYLVVRGGTLVVRMEALQPGQLHLRAATVASGSGIAFAGAQGSLDLDGTAIHASGDVELRGDLAAQVDATGDLVRAQVTGTPEQVLVDSLPVAMPVAAGPPTWTFALLAVPALLGAAGALWRRSASRAFHRAQAAMEARDYRTVAQLPNRLLRSGRFAPEAAVLRATAAIRLGRYQDAEAALDDWPDRAYPWDRDFLRAHLHALRGHWSKAADSLHACLTQAPQMAAAAAADPLLARMAAPAPAAAAAPREGYT